MKLKWVTNIPNPFLKESKENYPYSDQAKKFPELKQQEWSKHRLIIRNYVFGPAKTMQNISYVSLKKHHMIGLYKVISRD